MSASIVDCWSRACTSADEPNDTTPTLSEFGFGLRYCLAAATAWSSGAPCIDFDRSIASMTALLWPRLCTSSPRTCRPFSKTFGGCAVFCAARTTSRTTG